ncbi:class I SAM-dependent methyltransferase [Actinomadura fibrosa]|uniref:Class I SAM-dependent methyltransferase n=1 Tax=Actinomadura fibrosa TaxID=111802 RepID=A0ABW2XUD6_9ACTN|nr:methyltransferase domain-containing protein [Actinomadura fibrosa]
MNQAHLTYLSSPEWAGKLRTELLPWLREAADLGGDVLEIGPGFGVTTELLLEVTSQVTAVELDPALAAEVRTRFRGAPVEVVEGDATVVDLPVGRFSAATCFSMLHHVPSPSAQDRLLSRLHRALGSGAALLGVESIDTDLIRQGHVDDTYVPVDPDTFGSRLEAAGFQDAQVTRINGYQFQFVARNSAGA